MKLTIGIRLMISFFFIILIATANGVISLYYFSRLDSITTEITTRNHPRMEAVNELKNAIQDLERAVESHFSEIKGTPQGSIVQSNLLRIKDELEEVEQSLEVLRSIEVSPQDTTFQVRMFGFGGNFARLKLVVTEVTDQDYSAKITETGLEYQTELFDITNSLKKECNRLRRSEADMVDYLASQARGNSLTGYRYVIVLLLFGLVVGVILAYHTTWTLVKPIGRLSDATLQVSRGNLEVSPKIDSPPELKQLADSFSQMTAKLRDAFEKQKLLVAQVSHQLRTPLTIVRGHAEVALRGPEKESSEYKQALQQVIESTKQISRFVSNLLTLSQADFGQLVLNKSTIDLNEILREVYLQGQAISSSRSFRLNLEDEKQNLQIYADPERVKELFMILLENAVKYTRPDSVIEICSKGDSEGIHGLVKDNGIGIPEKHLPYIFDRFYRVRNEDTQSGFGLGLTIASWIAEAHRATIRVDSQAGKGSCFSVTFPRQK
jgi:signal transduction histidine kinase